jgi:putative flippase GtrA
VAVEAAIVAKFIWHRHWTWSDRFDGGRNRTLSTLIRFNLSNGVVSISGNLLSAYALTTAWNLDPVLSNLVSIPICSIANFLLCDWFVFVTGGDS